MKLKIIKITMILFALFCLVGCNKEKPKETYNFNIIYLNDLGKTQEKYPANSVVNTPKTPTKDGCIFVGWYYDIAYTKKVTFPITINENTSIYAAWMSLLNYELDENTNSYTVVSCMYGVDKVVVPEKFDDILVTKIGKNAFENISTLKEVTLPNTITEIEEGAFGYCSNLKKINVPDSVKYIGKNAFAGSNKIEYEELNGLKYLNNWLIEVTNIKLQSIKFKETTIGIYPYAFSGKENISEIEIPKNVSRILEGTFQGSTITKIKIHENVNNIDLSAFYDTSLLESIVVDANNLYYTSLNDVLYDKNITSLLIYPKNRSFGKYEMPNTVIELTDNVFENNNNIKEVILSNNLIRINDYAFYGCKNLTSVLCNNKIQYIGSNAFGNCYSLKSLLLPSTVKEIRQNAFYNMSSLETLKLSYLPSSDDLSTFDYLFGKNFISNKLTELTIYNITSLNKTNLKGLNILEKLYLPATLSSIEEGSFSDLINLSQLVLDINNTYFILIDGALYSSDYKNLIYYLPKQEGAYYYTNNKTINIYERAFINNENLVKIKLNDGLLNIGKEAFYNLPNLKKLIIPNSVITTGQDICFITPKVTIYSNLPYRQDGWSEGWNTLNYPTIWNAHFPKFVNVEIENHIEINESYTITFDIVDAPESYNVVVEVVNNNEIIEIDGFIVTGLKDGMAQIKMYLEGYEEDYIIINIVVGTGM